MYRIYCIRRHIVTCTSYWYTGCVIQNFDVLQGGGEEPLKDIKSKNFSQCQDSCTSLSECTMWTYYGGNCFLKEEGPIPSINPHTISGTKECNQQSKFIYLLIYYYIKYKII